MTNKEVLLAVASLGQPAPMPLLSPLQRVRFVSARSGLLRMASATASQTPLTDIIRTKLTSTLEPTTLEIRNDSHLHSHHKAMAGSTSQETHFALNVVSDHFKGKMQAARHRMVYGILKDELAMEGGVHALQIKAKTPEEVEKMKAREMEGS